jgi:hypothetical protein
MAAPAEQDGSEQMSATERGSAGACRAAADPRQSFRRAWSGGGQAAPLEQRTSQSAPSRSVGTRAVSRGRLLRSAYGITPNHCSICRTTHGHGGYRTDRPGGAERLWHANRCSRAGPGGHQDGSNGDEAPLAAASCLPRPDEGFYPDPGDLSILCEGNAMITGGGPPPAIEPARPGPSPQPLGGQGTAARQGRPTADPCQACSRRPPPIDTPR